MIKSYDKNNITYKPGVLQILAENAGSKSVAILTTGSLIGEALQASEKLKAKSIGSFVVNLNMLNKVDTNELAAILKKCDGRLVTVEDHQVLLGLGSFVAHQLALAGVNTKLKSLGVRGEFGQSAYNAIELYRKHHVDSDSMVKAAQELI